MAGHSYYSDERSHSTPLTDEDLNPGGTSYRIAAFAGAKGDYPKRLKSAEAALHHLRQLPGLPRLL